MTRAISGARLVPGAPLAKAKQIVIQRGPSYTHDPRYQVDPAQAGLFRGEFCALGIGRYIEETAMNNMPQGRRIIELLKRRPMTSMEILQTGISTCWWKRVAETIRHDEKLSIAKRADGINVYRVVSEKP